MIIIFLDFHGAIFGNWLDCRDLGTAYVYILGNGWAQLKIVRRLLVVIQLWEKIKAIPINDFSVRLSEKSFHFL